MPYRQLFSLPLAGLMLAAALPDAVSAADLPFMTSAPPIYGAARPDGGRFGGGGFQVAAVPVRPAPRRYDIYGYPVLATVPNPLAVSSGCPAAIQPGYDPDGNFAGYAPIPMCR